MPITIYPGSMKKRNANGSYSDLVPAIATDPEVLDDFAEEYSTSETYNIGDYCIHNSVLYKCNTNNTTGTWNNNAWDRVSVADELVDHKNTLNQFDQNMAYVESGNTATRNYSSGEFISWKGTLYTANGTISSGQSFSTGTGGNLTLVAGNNNSGGGLNKINDFLSSTAESGLAWENNAATVSTIDLGKFKYLAFGAYQSLNGSNYFATTDIPVFGGLDNFPLRWTCYMVEEATFQITYNATTHQLSASTLHVPNYTVKWRAVGHN